MCSPRQPRQELLPAVWPSMPAFAATSGIIILFSFRRYQDCSIPFVRSMKLCIHLVTLRVAVSSDTTGKAFGGSPILSQPNTSFRRFDTKQHLRPRPDICFFIASFTPTLIATYLLLTCLFTFSYHGRHALNLLFARIVLSIYFFFLLLYSLVSLIPESLDTHSFKCVPANNSITFFNNFNVVSLIALNIVSINNFCCFLEAAEQSELEVDS